MSTISMIQLNQPIFQTRKGMITYNHFRTEDNQKCDECEGTRVQVFCKNCDQHLCSACDTKIHNKGKRAQHPRQQVKTSDFERPSKVIFISFDSFKETMSVSKNHQSVGTKLYTYVSSILETNKLVADEIAVYVYYNSTNDVSEECAAQLCESMSILKYAFFVNTNDLNAALGKKEGNYEMDRVSQLGKCLSVLSGGYEKVFIYDQANSIEIGFAIFTSESTELSENQKVYITEGAENTQSNQVMKMVELTPRKSMKFMNQVKQSNKQNLSKDNEDLKKTNASIGNGSELTGNSRLVANNLSFSDDLTFSQSSSKTINSPARLIGYTSSLNQSMDSNANNSFTNFNQSFESGHLSTKSLYDVKRNVNDLSVSTVLTAKADRTEMSSRQFNSMYSKIRQPLREVEVDGSLKLSHYLQGELRKLAFQGELMIPKDQFIQMIDETIRTKFNKKTEQVLENAQAAEIIHVTTRKFADDLSFNYVSLQLQTITVESLGWICRSIKRDAMTPTEKLIISRVKECFGFKLESKAWRTLLNFLLGYQKSNRKLPIGDSTGILPLRISAIIDPSTGTELHAVYIKGEEWVAEDMGTMDENSQAWKMFVAFLDDYFREDEEEVQKRSQIAGEPKSILGGRYGCAQFIKACGPDELRKESLGKLNLYVQEAINRGIIRYQRTLLVKNTQASIFEGKYETADQTGGNSDPLNETRLQQLKLIKQAIIEMLAENPEGLSLAQIPQFLRRKISFSYNLVDLGFPKLKNLLATMTDDIKVDLSGTNHSFASLKHPEKYAHLAQKNVNRIDESQGLFGLNTNSMKPECFPRQETANQMNFPAMTSHSGFHIKKFNTLTPEHQTYKSNKFGYRTKFNSSFDGYLHKVRLFIEEITMQAVYGLDIEQLYSQLSLKLGNNFDHNIFGSRSFYDFLINHAEDLVDMQVKKHHGLAMTTYLIFPKNFRFMPGFSVKQQTQPEQFHQTPMKSSKPPLHSGTNSYFNGNSNNYQSGMGFNGGSMNQVRQGHNKTESKEKIYFSPLLFYGNQDDNLENEGIQTHHRSESYLNLNFIPYDDNLSSISGIQNLQFDGKSKMREESYMETNENIRFIENLLSENDAELNSGYSFQEAREEANSFTSLNMSYTHTIGNAKYENGFHNKVLSGDLSNNCEKITRTPPGLGSVFQSLKN